MKITAIHCTPVRVPRRRSFESSLGVHTHSENAVVETSGGDGGDGDDGGTSGIGEISSIWDRFALREAEFLRDKLAPLLGFTCDLNGVEYHADDVIRETLPIRDGFIGPPPGPGLGVSLDRKKIEEYRVD